MDVRLIMFREDGSQRVFNLNPGSTTIGRKTDCHIRIPLSEVSRRHAELFVKGDSITLKDLGAANGTFLNSRKISEEELEPGDQIMIGPVIFSVQINGQPSDEALTAVRTKSGDSRHAAEAAPAVGTSKHVYISDEEIDPIAALEALASSADQTAINPEDEG